MNILITNDDGIHAEGLKALSRVLMQEHAVFVLAPENERSACSNAITVRSNLELIRYSDTEYSLSGFPADCVIIGINRELFPDIDLVVSGINHGPNVGDDLFFSGTVAGARTAAIFGKPAIAVSINSPHIASSFLDNAALYVNDFINRNLAEIVDWPSNMQVKESGYGAPVPFFYNINYPDLAESEIAGEKITFSGKRAYRNSFQTINPRLRTQSLSMVGEIESIEIEGSDATELRKGYISITPLSLNSTNRDMIELIKTQ